MLYGKGPASAQANLGRNLLPQLNFLQVKSLHYLTMPSCRMNKVKVCLKPIQSINHVSLVTYYKFGSNKNDHSKLIRYKYKSTKWFGSFLSVIVDPNSLPHNPEIYIDQRAFGNTNAKRNNAFSNLLMKDAIF